MASRYVLIKKIGFGPYSTGWIARDCKLDLFVAIKIYKSSPFFRECALHECKILLELNKLSTSQEAFESIKQKIGVEVKNLSIVKLLNSFTHSAANGNHCCLVLELLGPSLESLLATYSGQVRAAY